jgi:MarR family transcriptional regulator, organic hydroperoxide resistance regulator
MGGVTSSSKPTSAAAVEAWRTMRDLMLRQRSAMLAIASEFELSPPQLFALRALEPGEPAPMSGLAGILRCDASNVTGIVDRLEDRGLVERRAAPHDRRVKHLVLTDDGAALRERLAARMDEPPEGFLELSPAEARALRDVLRKVAAAGSARRA